MALAVMHMTLTLLELAATIAEACHQLMLAAQPHPMMPLQVFWSLLCLHTSSRCTATLPETLENQSNQGEVIAAHGPLLPPGENVRQFSYGGFAGDGGNRLGQQPSKAQLGYCIAQHSTA